MDGSVNGLELKKYWFQLAENLIYSISNLDWIFIRFSKFQLKLYFYNGSTIEICNINLEIDSEGPQVK